MIRMNGTGDYTRDKFGGGGAGSDTDEERQYQTTSGDGLPEERERINGGGSSQPLPASDPVDPGTVDTDMDLDPTPDDESMQDMQPPGDGGLAARVRATLAENPALAASVVGLAAFALAGR